MVKPKLLIFGRNEGAPYHPLAAIQAELESLFEPAFDVRSTDRGESLLALGPSGVRLLVAVDDRWREDGQRVERLDAVEAWLRAGGSVLLLHNGVCWAGHPRWKRLAGGEFTGHAEARVLTFTRNDGASFELFEEPYRFSTPWLSGNRVFVTYEDDGPRPAFWTRRVGRGRLGYALPGHSAEAYRHPVYREWLLRLAAELMSS